MAQFSYLAFATNSPAKKREADFCTPEEKLAADSMPLAERWLNADELSAVRQKVGKVDLDQPETDLFKELGF